MDHDRPTLGFLHTSPVHVDGFDALVADLDRPVATAVVVDEDLLARARELGPGEASVRQGIADALDRLDAAGASVIVCTCSTIGGEAERLGADRATVVTRVDRAMATAAVAAGSRVAVVAALDSTIEPTTALLTEEAVAASAPIELTTVVCPGAWDRFEAGDHDGYLDTVAGCCRDLADEADVIVLAQASMAGAADRLDLSIPVLSSPRLAVEAAARQLGSGPA